MRDERKLAEDSTTTKIAASQKICAQCVHVWALLLAPNVNHTCIACPQPFPDAPPLLCTLFSLPIHQNILI